VKEMLLKEPMYLVVIAKLRAALLEMLDPVETCVLNLRWKTPPDSTTFDVSYERAQPLYATDILLEGIRHELDTASGQPLMYLLVVYSEVRICTPVFIKQEVAK
jgi:hypothetical protein